MDGSARQSAKQQHHPLAELAQAEVPEASTAAAVEGASAQQAPEADEQVSDTDNEGEGKHNPSITIPCCAGTVATPCNPKTCAQETDLEAR